MFEEGLIDDDGIRLATFSIIPESFARRLSEKFQKYGWIQPDQWIYSVTKYHFYSEFFSILRYQDHDGVTLGYYCDIVTPVQRKGNEYFLTDLILDLWVFPDLRGIELDRDEFESAVSTGIFPSNLEKDTRITLDRLKSDLEKGSFPGNFLY